MNSLIIIQTFIILATGFLSHGGSVSQDSCSNEEAYTGTVPSSCEQILADYPATPSGNYLIQSPGYGASVQVYCDMENTRCGSKGWTRVAYVDVSNVTSCPGNFRYIRSAIDTCAGLTTAGCASATFSTHGISYSQVCGRLRGYQVGATTAFGPTSNNPGNPDLVMDGILISHGTTQKHIWAYATGYSNVFTDRGEDNNAFCPCTDPARYTGVVPPFIGNDYYCDSGAVSHTLDGWFFTTPLWTGTGCTPPNFCCSQSGMPWFCKTLPVSTTDYIELRNCHNRTTANIVDTALDLIEIYIR